MIDILKIKMQVNDAEAETIGDYLRALLRALWEQGECFSGKRPFGNSGWNYELYQALIAAKAVKGELDEDGYVQEIDEEEAANLIFQAIEQLGAPQ